MLNSTVYYSTIASMSIYSDLITSWSNCVTVFVWYCCIFPRFAHKNWSLFFNRIRLIYKWVFGPYLFTMILKYLFSPFYKLRKLHDRHSPKLVNCPVRSQNGLPQLVLTLAWSITAFIYIKKHVMSDNLFRCQVKMSVYGMHFKAKILSNLWLWSKNLSIVLWVICDFNF